MNWYILEWNPLDDDVDLYEFETDKTDIAEVWEEASEDLHNFSSILVMNGERLRNLLKAAEPFQTHLKGGAQDNDEHD